MTAKLDRLLRKAEKARRLAEWIDALELDDPLGYKREFARTFGVMPDGSAGLDVWYGGQRFLRGVADDHWYILLTCPQCGRNIWSEPFRDLAGMGRVVKNPIPAEHQARCSGLVLNCRCMEDGQP